MLRSRVLEVDTPKRSASLSNRVAEARAVRVVLTLPAGNSQSARFSTMSDCAVVVVLLLRSV